MKHKVLILLVGAILFITSCSKESPKPNTSELQISSTLEDYDSTLGGYISIVEIDNTFLLNKELLSKETTSISPQGAFELSLKDSSAIKLTQRKICDDGKVFPVRSSFAGHFVISTTATPDDSSITAFGTLVDASNTLDPITFAFVYVEEAVTVQESCAYSVPILGEGTAQYSLDLEAGWNLIATRLSATTDPATNETRLLHIWENYTQRLPSKLTIATLFKL